jgi:hypothetical protein
MYKIFSKETLIKDKVREFFPINIFRFCRKLLVGNGERTKFWEDLWIGDSTSAISLPDFTICLRINICVRTVY